MNKINLKLEISEVNLIIKALSERPFREVYEVIGSIHAQSNAQLPAHSLKHNQEETPKEQGG